MTRGGKRPGAGPKPKAPEERSDNVAVNMRLSPAAIALLDELHGILGGWRGEVVEEALRALDREVRKPAKRRKGE